MHHCRDRCLLGQLQNLSMYIQPEGRGDFLPEQRLLHGEDMKKLSKPEFAPLAVDGLDSIRGFV